jgi:hypothetical protein
MSRVGANQQCCCNEIFVHVYTTKCSLIHHAILTMGGAYRKQIVSKSLYVRWHEKLTFVEGILVMFILEARTLRTRPVLSRSNRNM